MTDYTSEQSRRISEICLRGIEDAAKRLGKARPKDWFVQLLAAEVAKLKGEFYDGLGRPDRRTVRGGAEEDPLGQLSP